MCSNFVQNFSKIEQPAADLLMILHFSGSESTPESSWVKLHQIWGKQSYIFTAPDALLWNR